MDRQTILERLKANEAPLRARGAAHAALFGSRARRLRLAIAAVRAGARGAAFWWAAVAAADRAWSAPSMADSRGLARNRHSNWAPWPSAPARLLRLATAKNACKQPPGSQMSWFP